MINAYIKKQEKHQTTLQGTRKDKQMNPKVNRREAITNITVEINEIETKKAIEKNNEIKSFF